MIGLGFKNIHVLDIASQPLIDLKSRIGESSNIHFYQADFFDLDEKFDLILEQTFFCALAPYLRTAYAEKMYQMMNKKGRLVGLLFDLPLNSRPPYGGHIHEYRTYFEPYFYCNTFQRAYNSYYKRFPKEIFINLVKK